MNNTNVKEEICIISRKVYTWEEIEVLKNTIFKDKELKMRFPSVFKTHDLVYRDIYGNPCYNEQKYAIEITTELANVEVLDGIALFCKEPFYIKEYIQKRIM